MPCSRRKSTDIWAMRIVVSRRRQQRASSRIRMVRPSQDRELCKQANARVESPPDSIDGIYDQLEEPADANEALANISAIEAGWLAKYIRDSIEKESERARDDMEKELAVCSLFQSSSDSCSPYNPCSSYYPCSPYHLCSFILRTLAPRATYAASASSLAGTLERIGSLRIGMHRSPSGT